MEPCKGRSRYIDLQTKQKATSNQPTTTNLQEKKNTFLENTAAMRFLHFLHQLYISPVCPNKNGTLSLCFPRVFWVVFFLFLPPDVSSPATSVGDGLEAPRLAATKDPTSNFWRREKKPPTTGRLWIFFHPKRKETQILRLQRSKIHWVMLVK